jgi:HlyD family secretion protein
MAVKRVDTTKSLRRYQTAGFLSIFVVVAAFGGWSAYANINGAIIAPAVITVESFSKKIQHKEGGIVAAINVKDGDIVTAGQELVRLNDTEIRSELDITEALLVELKTKRARLEAQRDGAVSIDFPPEIMGRANEPDVVRVIKGQQKLFDSHRSALAEKKNQLREQIGQLNQQIVGLAAQQESKEKQIALIDDELDRLIKLQKQGLVPTSRVLEMQRARAQLDGERGQMIAAKAQAEGKIGEIKVVMIQTDEEDRSQVLTDLRDAESKIAEMSERNIAAKSKLDRSSIKAPIDGTVYQVAVHTIGGVIAPGDPIMLIVPKGDNLVIQAQVSPQDIEQIHVGQNAIVRFPALHDRFTPEIDADVVTVAADTSQTDRNTPPYYPVRLALSSSNLAKLGVHQLKPGMPAEAFIRTDARSPLSYLLKPLMDQVAHTFREK